MSELAVSETDVTVTQPGLVIELTGQPFARLVVSHPDPAGPLERLGLAAHGSSS